MDDSVPATWLCGGASCKNKAVCDEHALLHQRRQHPLTSLLGRSADAGPQALCSKADHASTLAGALTLYCLTCRCAVCVQCTALDHPAAAHDVKPLSDAAAALTRSLHDDVRDLQAAQQRLLAFTTGDVDNAVALLHARCDAATTAIADAAPRWWTGCDNWWRPSPPPCAARVTPRSRR